MKKNTFNSSKFKIYLSDRLVFECSRQVSQEENNEPLNIYAGDRLRFECSGFPSGLSLFLFIGSECVAEVESEGLCWRTEERAWLHDLCGKTEIFLKTSIEKNGNELEFFCSKLIGVIPLASTARDFRTMCEDLSVIHEGLIRDIISRGFLSRSLAGTKSKILDPPILLKKLESIADNLKESITAISTQPSTILRQESVFSAYKAGDIVDHRTIQFVLRQGINIKKDKSAFGSGKSIPVRRPKISDDIPEHRHIAKRIKQLSIVASNIATHCQKIKDLLEADENRWGGAARNGKSVFELMGLPRISQIEGYRHRADALKTLFLNLVKKNKFLSSAGEPRTPFGPTPIFCGRPQYIRTYRSLCEGADLFGRLVDGDSIRIHMRNLATLYEYWCFLKTLEVLKSFFGQPEPAGTIKLVDDIYRPDILPGQSFMFNSGLDCKIKLTYEMEILPWEAARRRRLAWGATLTSRPLRPDIVVSLERQGEPEKALILDAKSGSNFTFNKFREISAYDRQIFRIKDGIQPVHGFFLLHRDQRKSPICNTPGFFDFNISSEVVVIGAIPVIPSEPGVKPAPLRDLLGRFLTTRGVRIPMFSESAA